MTFLQNHPVRGGYGRRQKQKYAHGKDKTRSFQFGHAEKKFRPGPENHETGANLKNPESLALNKGVESNSSGTLGRRRHQLPSERNSGNLETPSESNFNHLIDPNPLIPDEVKNDPQMLQIWKELGEDMCL